MTPWAAEIAACKENHACKPGGIIEERCLAKAYADGLAGRWQTDIIHHFHMPTSNRLALVYSFGSEFSGSYTIYSFYASCSRMHPRPRREKFLELSDTTKTCYYLFIFIEYKDGWGREYFKFGSLSHSFDRIRINLFKICIAS